MGQSPDEPGITREELALATRNPRHWSCWPTP